MTVANMRLCLVAFSLSFVGSVVAFALGFSDLAAALAGTCVIACCGVVLGDAYPINSKE